MVTKRPINTGGELDLSTGTFGHRRAAAYGSKAFTGGALVADAAPAAARQRGPDRRWAQSIHRFDRKLAGLGAFIDDVGASG